MPTLIQAANNLFNPLTAESADLRPKNCHEAVLGWLLISLNYPRRWRLLRLAAARPNHGIGTPIQFQGEWMWQNLYQPRTQITPANMATVQAGDVLCSGAFGRPTHSMVVVSVGAGAVNIRGFNNAGTFAHLNSPYMQYDNADRDVAAANIWDMTGNHPNKFGPATVDLFVIAGHVARQNAAQAFPWEGSAIPVTVGARWHYNAIQGWRWY